MFTLLSFGAGLDTVPAESDLYIISRVLLNWNDADALKILRNCRAAMDASATLLIMDAVLPNKVKEASTVELLGGLYAFMLSGHFLRTEDEYHELLSNAGFQSSTVIETGATIVNLRFIEAVPK
ncbi:MAG: hypothetical protein GY862_38310 [Gammaproteobacteria bacterium]|nr:hypothetical protein [Gammaproteobacteria bacterium]